MSTAVRDNVPAVAGLLSVVSLALVVGAVRGLLPMDTLPHVDGLLAAIPHLNAAISVVAVVTIIAGVRAIRHGDIVAHRRRMLTALGLFAAFLVLYLYRVGVEGPTEFGGPDVLYTYLYLPLLGIHMALAMVCIPLLYYVVLLAVTRPVSEIPTTRHPRVGRIATGLWITSFVLGVAVYAQLYWIF